MSWNFDPAKRLWPRVNKGSANECWEWQGARTAAGYGILTIKYKNYLAHRLAWKLSNGKELPEGISEGMFVCHHCDNPACCNPSHLFLGTQKENLEDAASKNRIPYGEGHHNTNLSENDIRQIRKFAYGSNLTRQEIARRFGIARTTVNDIIQGRTWAHVDPEWKPPGSKSRGLAHPNAKLNEKDVKEIRKLSAQGLSQRKIAKQFDVSRGTIEPILKGETWTHVDPNWKLPQKEKKAKLNENDVRQIRQLHEDGQYNSLAKRFGVSKHTIISAIKRRTWKHVS